MMQQIRLKLPNWSLNNVILLNVRLNDSTLIRMMLDTGAKYTIIRPEVARRLEIDLAQTRRIAVTTATQMQSARLLQLKRVDIHGLALTDIDAAIMEIPDGLGVDGLLGLSFLRHCRLVLDIPKQILELEIE